jgi:hypothetical protein
MKFYIKLFLNVASNLIFDPQKSLFKDFVLHQEFNFYNIDPISLHFTSSNYTSFRIMEKFVNDFF